MKFRKKFILLPLSCLLLCLFFPGFASAESTRVNTCENRFVTIVNPIRGRSLWIDKTLNPLVSQYAIVKKYNYPATWLLQYDALKDEELRNLILTFDKNQELGAFLEVSNSLASDAKILYPDLTPWFNPKAVFLSGYQRSERKKMIDSYFKLFRQKFGYYPKSVGAWWIDSYSLEYMVKKYHIKAVLIVADQKTTDNYGVWGQWWGVPYYPAKTNILTPAKDLRSKLNMVVTQWAQRDLALAYKEGPMYSNYSLQANDYIKQGKDTSYFKNLVEDYLNCSNKIGQVTVGLETGIESVAYLKEYANQMAALSKIPNLKALSMSEFSEKYRQVFPRLMDGYVLSDKNSQWNLTKTQRSNTILGDYINYDVDKSFSDYFVKDSSDFLRRYQTDLRSLATSKWYYPGILVLVIAFILLARISGLPFSLSALFYCVSSFWFLIFSFEKFGWRVFFGPEINNLAAVQVGVVLTVFIAFFLLNRFIFKKFKSRKILYAFLPLSFAVDYLIGLLRYSFLNGIYYFGTFWQKTKFIGITLGKNPFHLDLAVKDFPANTALNFLSLNYQDIWKKYYYWLLISPLIHLGLGILLYFLYRKLNNRLRNIFLALVIVLYLFFLWGIVTSDPQIAVAVLK